MFQENDILYEDNHLLVVNKRCGDLVQPDPSGVMESPGRSFSGSYTGSTVR